MNYESRKKIFGKSVRALHTRLSLSYFSTCYRLSTANYSRGFSIVETIVAIAILAVVVVTPLSLAQRGLNASLYAKDQVTAFFLAQEAIEYVRYIRDSNNLKGFSQTSNWLSGLQGCISPNICGIDVTATPSSKQIIDCPTDPKQCLLTFNSVTGIYGERRNNGNGNPDSGWQNSIFTRKLQITKRQLVSDPNAEADLAATVSWQTGKISKSITVYEKIFDWFPAKVN